MFEIYFSDLKPEVQTELLSYMEIASPEEMNWDIFPLTVIDGSISGSNDIDVMAEMKEMQNLVENFGIGI